MQETNQPTPTETPPVPPLRRSAFAPPGVLYASGAVIAILLTTALFWWNSRPQTYPLRMTAGDKLGRRHDIAQVLARDVRRRGVRVSFTETSGSSEALEMISEGKLDCALIQGGIGTQPHVRQVASITQEPLHLLVKRELGTAVNARGLLALRGKRVNLSTRGSGTRRIATIALGFADLHAGRDFEDEDISYKELESRAYIHLPDALFTVSLIPSPVVERLVHRHGYVLVSIPFARALSLRQPTLHEVTIPAFAYGVTPAPTPPTQITTIGTQLLLVARDSVPDEAVKRLLEGTFAGDFARDATLPGLTEAGSLSSPEMPIHLGAIAYRDRNEPVVTSDLVQGLEDGKSFVISILVAIYFVYRWWRQRRYSGFDVYMGEVTRIERSALALEAEATPNVHELMRLRNELGEMKTNALEKYTRGELKSEELMSAFLTHVADVRGYLSALILAERERLSEMSRDTIPDAEQSARFRAQWEGGGGVGR
ncbi:MAG: hypothetical protein H7145_09575 [Akkermansiaceae bacterium]|nr:hypothetical protein [Armatimonadota bacterium]